MMVAAWASWVPAVSVVCGGGREVLVHFSRFWVLGGRPAPTCKQHSNGISYVRIFVCGVWRVHYHVYISSLLTSLYDGSQADGVMIWPLAAYLLGTGRMYCRLGCIAAFDCHDHHAFDCHDHHAFDCHDLDRHPSSFPQILPTCAAHNYWLHSSTPMLETLVSWRWWIL